MIVAVFDTNVLASGIAGAERPESTPGELLRRWRARHFTLVVSVPILLALERTLSNPYFSSRFSSSTLASTVARLSTEAHVQLISVHIAGVATHPEDDVIVATALSARAPFLVTGDRQLQQRHAYGGTRLVSPRQFLDILERSAVP